MDIDKKEKEIVYLEDLDSTDDLSYDSQERYDVNIEDKIEEISHDYMMLLKKYTDDECISIGEKLSYLDLFNFIDKLI